MLLVSRAAAWDAVGHMLIGQIAWELSSPEVRKSVNELVATLDNRFNARQPYNFVTVGCWMDDMRALPRGEYKWATWHYVNAEKSDDGSAFIVPEPPHIIWAIDENLKTLRERSASAADRAQALGMLFHWVQDIHQPLHATTWNDRGGNGYLISGVKFSDLVPGQISNLHTFWDKAFRFDGRDGGVFEVWTGPVIGERPSPGEGIIAEQARALMKRFPRSKLAELVQPGDAERWARESHRIGCESAYPPGEHPGNMQAPRLDPEFAHQASEIAQRRLVVAGYRLAALLNELFETKR